MARVVYIGGFPIGEGDAVADGYPAENGEVPLPDWTEFEDEDLADLDDEARAKFRDRAVPSPEHVTRDAQQLSDERRYDVPVSVISTEFTSDMLRGWIAQGLAPVREFTKIHDVEYVDLPTGHWPQFTRPEELGRTILAIVDRTASTAGVATASGSRPAVILDDHGRPEPPLSADEVGTVLGFLEFQRATLAWKCEGLDAVGLQATTAASSMTLGGMLKHLAYVEDVVLSTSARAKPRAAVGHSRLGRGRRLGLALGR